MSIVHEHNCKSKSPSRFPRNFETRASEFREYILRMFSILWLLSLYRITYHSLVRETAENVTFLQDFIVVLKFSLQNYNKILNKCLLGTDSKQWTRDGILAIVTKTIRPRFIKSYVGKWLILTRKHIFIIKYLFHLRVIIFGLKHSSGELKGALRRPTTCSDPVGGLGIRCLNHESRDLTSVGQHDLRIEALNKDNTYMPSMRFVSYLSCC